MFPLVFVILLFAEKGSGAMTGKSNSTVSSDSTTKNQSTATTVTNNTRQTSMEIKNSPGDGPKILNTSVCEHLSEVLTCTCISEGFPLPTINWPHVENHTKYSVKTIVSNRTVTSTVIVSLKHFDNTTVECVSSTSIGTAKLTIATKSQNPFSELLKTVQEPKVIFAALAGFVVGIVLSAIIFCMVTKSCRKKQKTSADLSENLEMVTTEAVPMMDADQAAVHDGICEPQEVEGEAQFDGQLAPDVDLAPKEVEYSDINFSALKTRNPEEAERTMEIADTDYAEIKRDTIRQENSQEDSEMLEGNEEKELITGEDNDAKKAEEEGGEEEGGEDAALYSSVEEIMG